MKRSHEVMLWMLGAGLGVAILSEDKTVEQLKQDRYASKEDCLKDWGSEESCQEEPSQGGSHASGGSGGGGGNADNRYRGPRYYWDRSAGHPVAVSDSGVHRPMPSAHPGGSSLSHSIGSVDAGSVTRGGFGHFSSRSGGG
ncbi:MAG TPA: hypothetical protein VFW53_08965 [Gallionella sp.]|nr:hypothetical protein [Gallionella sp.]